MTPKQQRFVEEYLIDLNGAQAAIRAGYSKRTARQIADENLSKPDIAAAVAARQAKISEKLEITQERVVQELAKIGFGDIRKLFTEDGGLRRVECLDDAAAACLAAVEVVTRRVAGSDRDEPEYENVAKIKLWDKRAALVDLGKHLGMFTDRVELTGKDGKAIEIEQKVREDADAVASAIASLAERARAGRVASDTQH